MTNTQNNKQQSSGKKKFFLKQNKICKLNASLVLYWPMAGKASLELKCLLKYEAWRNNNNTSFFNTYQTEHTRQ